MKRARCFAGSQSCNDGGRRNTWFRSQVRKRLLTQPAYPTPEHLHTEMFLSALARTARPNLSPTDSYHKLPAGASAGDCRFFSLSRECDAILTLPGARDDTRRIRCDWAGTTRHRHPLDHLV